MRKRSLAALAALCLLLGGCQGEEGGVAPTPSEEPVESVQVVVQKPFALPVEPAGEWDPYGGSRGGNLTLLPLLCESLYQLDNTFEAQPLLAASATVSEDGLAWTVRLRSGVRFSDGQALDAQSVAAAVNAARGEKSLYATRLSGVKRVTAQGEDTVVFELSRPNARFLALLDFPIARVTGGGVLGTGPYVLKEDKLTAREDWWRGLELPAEEIALREVANADALIADFNVGEVSLVADDPTGADSLGFSGGYQSWEYPTSTMVYLGFQCTRGGGKSAQFRRAISVALDRGELVNALNDHAWSAALPVHPASAGYDRTLAGEFAHDDETAGELLEELGYKLGSDGARYSGRRKVSLTLLVNSDNAYKEQLAQSVARQIRGLGIGVEVRSLSWEEYKKALVRGDFDLYLGEYRMTGDMDPGALITAGSGLYYGGFRSDELAGALDRARLSGDWGEFYELWAQQSPQAVLSFKNAAVLTQWGQLSGLEPTQGNLFYRLENWQIG